MVKQQGDVIFTKVEVCGSKKWDVKNGVLVEGEVTGHAHRLVDIAGVEFTEDKNGLLYLKTDKEITVSHEEHKSVTLEPGIWKIGRVKEYDHFAEESKLVRD